jgi:hypothetical protein
MVKEEERNGEVRRKHKGEKKDRKDEKRIENESKRRASGDFSYDVSV